MCSIMRKFKFKILILIYISITCIETFNLTEVNPKNITVLEGTDVILSCTVNNYYEWCTFIHNDKKCDFEWRRDVWNITTLDCTDFQDRIGVFTVLLY